MPNDRDDWDNAVFYDCRGLILTILGARYSLRIGFRLESGAGSWQRIHFFKFRRL